MVLPFLMICAVTLMLATITARWWVLWLPVSFGIFVVVTTSNQTYGAAGTALRIGFWMLVLTFATAAVIMARRRRSPMIRRT
jgi:hypothetical protein